jgi:hypothetical protein
LRIESVRLPDVAARRFRDPGLWRYSGPISDLSRWWYATPEALTITRFRVDEGAARISATRFVALPTFVHDMIAGSGEKLPVDRPPHDAGGGGRPRRE